MTIKHEKQESSKYNLWTIKQINLANLPLDDVQHGAPRPFCHVGNVCDDHRSGAAYLCLQYKATKSNMFLIGITVEEVMQVTGCSSVYLHALDMHRHVKLSVSTNVGPFFAWKLKHLSIRMPTAGNVAYIGFPWTCILNWSFLHLIIFFRLVRTNELLT